MADKIKIISTEEGFSEINAEWDAIAEGNSNYLPFCCHDWFVLWNKNFINKNELLVLKFDNNDAAALIVPLRKVTDKYRRLVIDKLELIGNVYSPVRCLLLDQNQDSKAIGSLFTYLFEQNKTWDILDLSTLPEEGGLIEQITGELKKESIPFKEYLCFGDWYQDDIACSGNEYLMRLPEKMRKDINYCKRRLEREGDLEIKVITLNNDLDYYMDLYYDVYSRSWQQQEKIGPTFHRDLASMAVNRGWLRLGFLFYNGIPLAAQFWLVANGTAFILKTVYDQDYKKHSPGKILTSEMFKYVIDIDKVTTIDYVQGDEGYKKDWTPKRRERKGILVYNNTLKGRYLSLLDTKIAPFVNSNSVLSKFKRPLGQHIRQ